MTSFYLFHLFKGPTSIQLSPEVLGVRTSTYEFEGDACQPVKPLDSSKDRTNQGGWSPREQVGSPFSGCEEVSAQACLPGLEAMLQAPAACPLGPLEAAVTRAELEPHESLPATRPILTLSNNAL